MTIKNENGLTYTQSFLDITAYNATTPKTFVSLTEQKN